MAHDNKNTNELVAEETAELEALTFRQDEAPEPDTDESDDNTFDFAEYSSGESKIVRKLRYDVEQLRSKWMGLEAELSGLKVGLPKEYFGEGLDPAVAQSIHQAIDEYKLRHRRRFITYEEMLTVITGLGYSK